MTAFIAGLLAAWALLDRYDPPQQLPLVKADYPLCVRVDPGPLVKRRKTLLYPHNSEFS